MKNIHVLPTDKPSRLVLDDTTQHLMLINKGEALWGNQHIYITSDEEIKEGYWYFDFNLNRIKKALEVERDRIYYTRYHCTIPTKAKKIILTTDTDLIKYGVQEIDDEFLEWYINNPFCEEVEIESWQTKGEWDLDYKIIIPKEEPKQETLEEAAESYSEVPMFWMGSPRLDIKRGFELGAKWQQEQDKNKYSEEEVIAFAQWMYDYKGDINKVEELLKQFKKK
jgi:hypothetical protein